MDMINELISFVSNEENFTVVAIAVVVLVLTLGKNGAETISNSNLNIKTIKFHLPILYFK